MIHTESRIAVIVCALAMVFSGSLFGAEQFSFAILGDTAYDIPNDCDCPLFPEPSISARFAD